MISCLDYSVNLGSTLNQFSRIVKQSCWSSYSWSNKSWISTKKWTYFSLTIISGFLLIRSKHVVKEYQEMPEHEFNFTAKLPFLAKCSRFPQKLLVEHLLFLHLPRERLNLLMLVLMRLDFSGNHFHNPIPSGSEVWIWTALFALLRNFPQHFWCRQRWNVGIRFEKWCKRLTYNVFVFQLRRKIDLKIRENEWWGLALQQEAYSVHGINDRQNLLLGDIPMGI